MIQISILLLFTTEIGNCCIIHDAIKVLLFKSVTHFGFEKDDEIFLIKCNRTYEMKKGNVMNFYDMLPTL